MSPPSRVFRQVAAAIKAYLAVHSNAADSEQGITDWWVPEMGLDASLDEVREALELLIQEGTVEMQIMADGRRLYRAGHGGGGTPAE
jgi:hypothetical protein